MSPRGRLLLLPVLVLLAAAINMPLAVWCSQIPPGTRGATLSNVIGPGAARFPWPAKTPHPRPWPPVHQHQVDRLKFGAVRTICWGPPNEASQTTHQMEVRRFGWPIASLQQVQRWWPWDDPAWKLNQPQDLGLTIRWSGALLNPLAAGGGAWALLVGVPWAMSILRRRRRLRAGLCPACAYPFSGSDRCTECGLPRPAPRPAAGSAAELAAGK